MKFDFMQACFVDQTVDRERDAIVGSDLVLTWAQLEEESDIWIRKAREHGAQRDVPLVILGHKQASFIVAITGCLRLGIPFVPIDTIYPSERIQRICDISKSTLLFRADQSRFEKLNEIVTPLAEKQLAYMMFTSGSTGEPKGVQIGVESVVELGSWMRDSFGLGDHPVFMNQAPFSFDLSVYEIVGTLYLGGTCVLNSREVISDTEKFYVRIRDHRATVWVSTPSFAYQQLLSRDFNQKSLPFITTFLFCGEVLSTGLVKHIRQRFPNSNIINTYGPTEATVATTSIFIDDVILNEYDPLPVGYQKSGTKIYCDSHTGELCIVGNNVMRGYINREDLNATKMFSQDGKRGFRTGDSGFVDENGLIFCSGRLDDQIKLHGYRIELSEIDAALRELPGVLTGATIALRKSDGTVVRLISYIVPSAENTKYNDLDLERWKEKLSNVIPNYMIPSEMIVCEALPMSTNDKVDRKALTEIYAKHNLNMVIS